MNSVFWSALQYFLVPTLLVASISIAHAETWLEHAQREVDQTAPDTEARLLAMMMANVAADHFDLEQALSMTDATVKFAESLNDRNALATSLMQRARVRREFENADASQEDYTRAASLFDGDCVPRMRVHFWIARMKRDRHIAAAEELVGYITNAMSAAEEANDSALRVLVEFALLSDRDPPRVNSEEFKHLRQLGGSSERWPVHIAFEMLELSHTAETLPPGKLVDRITAALPVLKESGIRRAYIGALNMLAATHVQLEEVERALELIDVSLEQARLLKSNDVVAHQLFLRGKWAESIGNQELAQAAYDEGVEMSLRVNTPLLRDSLYAEAVDQFVKNEDWDGLREMVSSAFGRVRAIEAQREEALQQRLDRVLSSRAADERAPQSVAHQRLVRLQRLTRNVGLAIFIAFLTICLLSGLRLYRVNRQLTEQIEEVRHGREMRAALERKVAQVERMDSLGMLAGGIAHDFNNLLTGVLCNAEVLRTRKQDELSRDCLDGIIRSAQAASDLSHKMLAYAGKRSSEKEACDLNETIREFLPLLRAGLGSDHTIHFTPLEEPAIAEIDPSQIEQLMLNLVTNARDSIENEGAIRIRVGEEVIDDAATDPTLFGQRTSGGEFVYFEVADDGKGIVPAVVQRMFEPFFSTRNGGRGLGLSVVYGYVNKHDGLIRCTSKEDEGTTMRILLPKCAADSLDATRGEGSDAFFKEDSDSMESDLRVQPEAPVVVVDDSHQVLDVIKRLLVKQGYPCEIHHGGAAVIEYLKENAGSAPCVVLDLAMPDVDGDAVLQWMQSNAAEVPVVVMSGYSGKNLEEYLQHSNVVGILEKPFSRRRLLLEIRRACDAGGISRLEIS